MGKDPRRLLKAAGNPLRMAKLVKLYNSFCEPCKKKLFLLPKRNKRMMQRGGQGFMQMNKKMQEAMNDLCPSCTEKKKKVYGQ